MGNNEFELEDRKFLHDLATPLTILKLCIKRFVSTLDSEKIEPKTQRILLEQIHAAIEKMEQLHAAQRSRIHDRSST